MFSVVMSVFNGALFLEEAILSILNQTFIDFEFIIIDDGSSDNTLEIIEKYALQDKRIVFLTRKNKGLIYSLNEAIALSKYDYIIRMDADDISYLDRFEEIAKTIRENKCVELISSGSILFDMDNNFICQSPVDLNEEKILRMLPGKNYISHPTVAYKKEFFYKCGGYNPVDKGIEDVALWLRMRSANVNYKFIKKHLLKYRINIKSVRNIDAENYQKIIFKECLVNHDKKSAWLKINNLPLFYRLPAIMMIAIPSVILDVYTIIKNNKKIRDIYNEELGKN